MKKLLSILLLVWGLFANCTIETEILVGFAKLQSLDLTLIVGDDAFLKAVVSLEEGARRPAARSLSRKKSFQPTICVSKDSVEQYKKAEY